MVTAVPWVLSPAWEFCISWVWPPQKNQRKFIWRVTFLAHGFLSVHFSNFVLPCVCVCVLGIWHLTGGCWFGGSTILSCCLPQQWQTKEWFHVLHDNKQVPPGMLFIGEYRKNPSEGSCWLFLLIEICYSKTYLAYRDKMPWFSWLKKWRKKPKVKSSRINLLFGLEKIHLPESLMASLRSFYLPYHIAPPSLQKEGEEEPFVVFCLGCLNTRWALPTKWWEIAGCVWWGSLSLWAIEISSERAPRW